MFASVLLVVAACGPPDSPVVAGDGAVQLSGWSGVNNLFQDGRMYFGGQPDEASLTRLAEEAGVTTVINLRNEGEMSRLGFDEVGLVQARGLNYVSVPLSPDSFSAMDVARFAAAVESTEEPVLLHCASSNRVGGMWAAYLVRHRGMDLEEAIRQGKAAGLRSESMIQATRRVARE
jgi:uncharacterized protein (TIGR01244 family)